MFVAFLGGMALGASLAALADALGKERGIGEKKGRETPSVEARRAAEQARAIPFGWKQRIPARRRP